MIKLNEAIKKDTNPDEYNKSCFEARSLVETLYLVDSDFSMLIRKIAKLNSVSISALIEELVLNLSELKIHNEEIAFETLKIITKISAVALANDQAEYRDILSFVQGDLENLESEKFSFQVEQILNNETLSQYA